MSQRMTRAIASTQTTVTPSAAIGHRDEMKVRVLALPALGEVRHVQILTLAHAPVQPHRALDAPSEGVFEDTLDRCEARRPRNEQDRPLTFAQREAT
jgi:hypothetical protein